VYYETHRVDITRIPEDDDTKIQHDVVIHQGTAEAEYIGDEFTTTNASADQAERFREICENLKETSVTGTREGELDVDPVTAQRLDDLGYI
jgi:hypothetical protein